jgi:hypothetical protein
VIGADEYLAATCLGSRKVDSIVAAEPVLLGQVAGAIDYLLVGFDDHELLPEREPPLLGARGGWAAGCRSAVRPPVRHAPLHV